ECFNRSGVKAAHVKSVAGYIALYGFRFPCVAYLSFQRSKCHPPGFFWSVKLESNSRLTCSNVNALLATTVSRKEVAGPAQTRCTRHLTRGLPSLQSATKK